MVARTFFHARDVEDIILDCYRLAKFYGMDPDQFLDKPLSVLAKHMKWTARLIQVQSEEDDA